MYYCRFGLTKKGVDIWPLVVGKVSNPGQAFSQGLVIGSVVVGECGATKIRFHAPPNDDADDSLICSYIM